MSARFRVPATKMQSAIIHQKVSNVFVKVDIKAMAKEMELAAVLYTKLKGFPLLTFL